MAHKVEFTKADKVNGKEYEKGDTLSVSDSIYNTLLANGSVKTIKEPKAKTKQEEV